MSTIKFKINGFHCEACVRLATIKLKKIAGVGDVTVSIDGQATIEAQHAVDRNEIVEALASAGYTVEM